MATLRHYDVRKNTLRRSNLTAPHTPLDRRAVQGKVNKTTSLLGKIAEIGSTATKIYSEEHQKDMVRQARNDIVNGTINGDLTQHEASYAQVVAKHEALKQYNIFKSQIAKGDFDNMLPKDFQSLLTDQHKKFKANLTGKPFQDLQASAYDDFMLENEATLTSGHGSKYRAALKQKQVSLLHADMAEMVKVPNLTADGMIQALAKKEYSMIKPHDIMAASLNAAGLTKNLTLLEDLNKEFNYETNPQLAKAYKATVNLIKKENAEENIAATRQFEYDTRTQVDLMVEKGTLTDEDYKTYRDKLGSDGNPIYTEEQFRAKVRKAAVKRAEIKAREAYTTLFQNGIDIADASPKDFNEISRNAWAALINSTEGDTILATEFMGAHLSRQSQVYKELKSRVQTFSREPMMVDREPNPESIRRFKEVEALEKGMTRYTNGAKMFAKYMGDSLADYFTIKETLELHRGTPEANWASIATSMEKQKTEATKKAQIDKITPDSQKLGQEISEEFKAKNDTGGFSLLRKPEDQGKDVATIAGRVIDKSLAEGRSLNTAVRTAKGKVYELTDTWAGQTWVTNGEDLAAVFGTGDKEGIYKAMIEDPLIRSALTPLYGMVIQNGQEYPATEMFMPDPDTASIFDRMKVGEAISPAQKRQARKTLKEETDRIFLDPAQIDMNLNLEKGIIEFTSERGEGLDWFVPIADVVAIYDAKKNGIEDIDLLERRFEPQYANIPDNADWIEKQKIANNQFSTGILGTEKAEGYTTVTPEEYNQMTDLDKTKIRMEFHEDKYEGVMGRMRQIYDYFKRVEQIKTPETTAITKDSIPQKTRKAGLTGKGIPDSTPVDMDNLNVQIGAGVGVRHNNPGNMIYVPGMRGATKGEYKGTDPKTGKKYYWAKYQSPEDGFRGLVRQIGIDEDRGDNLRKFLLEFAPKEDNNETEAYIDFVADKLGVDEKTSLTDLNNVEVARWVATYESKSRFR